MLIVKLKTKIIASIYFVVSLYAGIPLSMGWGSTVYLVNEASGIKSAIEDNLMINGVKIPKDFLNDCRLLMISNYLDAEKRAQESVSQQTSFNIPVSVTNDGESYTGLKTKSNRDSLYKYIKGRNVVLTQYIQNEEYKTVMIVTGLAPRWNTETKDKLEKDLGMDIVDIVDVLPIQENDINFSDIKENLNRQLLDLYNDFNNNIEQQITDITNNLTNDDATIQYDSINSILEGITSIIDKLEEAHDKKLSQKLSKIQKKITGIKNLIKLSTKFSNAVSREKKIMVLREILRNSIIAIRGGDEGYLNEKKIDDIYISALMTMHQNLGSPYAFFVDEKEKQSLLEYIKTQKFVKEIADLSKGAAKDRGVFSTPHPIWDSFLSYISHSEPLYLMWRINTQNPADYFFTQRDMCEGCDVTLLKNNQKFNTPFIILSALCSQRPGKRENNAAIDGEYIYNKDIKKWECKNFLFTSSNLGNCVCLQKLKIFSL